MNLPHMIEKLVGAVEWIGIPALTSNNGAWEVALEVSFHMAFHFKVPVKQLVGGADATFQDLGRLAT